MTHATSTATTPANALEAAFIHLLRQVPPEARASVMAELVAVSLAHLDA